MIIIYYVYKPKINSYNYLETLYELTGIYQDKAISQEEMQKMSNLTQRHAIDALHDLKELGYLEILEPNKVRITLAGITAAKNMIPPNMIAITKYTQNVAELSHGVKPSCEVITYNPPKENMTVKEAPSISSIIGYLWDRLKGQ